MANTPDSLRALQSLHQHIANVVADVAKLIAHRDALAAENKALVEALRKEQVGSADCYQCHGRWNPGEPERHSANCLARVRE